jgi:hypothetical protein
VSASPFDPPACCGMAACLRPATLCIPYFIASDSFNKKKP